MGESEIITKLLRLFLCVVSCLKKKTTSPLSEKSSSTTTNRHTTTMSEEKLGKLRGKLKEITEHIDEADQSKVDAVQSTGDAVSRLEKLETELQSSQRRTQLVAKDLSDINERLDVAEEKLNKATEQSEEIEASREELESKEQEGDERTEELESNLKDMRRTVEMNLLKVVEGDRKNNVCNNEIAKLREKAEKNEAIVTTLEEQIDGFGKRLEELEELEGAAGEREDLNEEKVTFLEGQLKETETRADAAERMHAVLSNVIVEMETEIAGWTQKIVDMEHTMVEMDNLADDPNYDLSKKYGKTAASAASPSGFGSRSAMFETKEQEGDERTEELESNLKDMKRTVEMNLLKVVEGDRKNNVCNNEIAKLREKAEKNEAIVTTLEEQIEGFGKRLEELEELEGAAGEREDLNEEKVTFLEGQLKETETRADAAERMHAVLSNVIVE